MTPEGWCMMVSCGADMLNTAGDGGVGMGGAGACSCLDADGPADLDGGMTEGGGVGMLMQR